MMLLLRSLPSVTDSRDGVVWNHATGDGFSVADCHSLIAKLHISAGPREGFDDVLALVWRQQVLLKVKAFRWRSFIDILPSKDLLAQKGIILVSNVVCVLYTGNQIPPSFFVDM